MVGPALSRGAAWASRLALAAAVLGAAATGCSARTLIHPAPQEEAPTVAYTPEGGCNVRDFPSATEVPAGSRNLGWVSVDQEGTDEETFLRLRQKICERGGNAQSQAAWVKGPSDETPKLTANAWVLP